VLGLPVSVARKQRSIANGASGLQAIALAARSVIFDGVEVAIGGGGESISLVQNNQLTVFMPSIPNAAMKGDAYIAMLDTANRGETLQYLAGRQDEYGLESQRRTAAAQPGRPLQRRTRTDQDHYGGHGQGEPVPVVSASDAVGRRRAASRYHAEGLAGLKPQRDRLHGYRRECEPASRTGASATVNMSDKLPHRRDKATRYLPAALIAAAASRRNGGGADLTPCPASKRHGLKIDDIDLWELNEAFAVQGDLLPRQARIDPEKADVNGGSDPQSVIPYGMTGARVTGHALIGGPRRQAVCCCTCVLARHGPRDCSN